MRGYSTEFYVLRSAINANVALGTRRAVNTSPMTPSRVGKAVARTGVAVTAAVVVAQTAQVALCAPVEGTTVITSWSTELSEAALQARALTGGGFTHRVHQSSIQSTQRSGAESITCRSVPIGVALAGR